MCCITWISDRGHIIATTRYFPLSVPRSAAGEATRKMVKSDQFCTDASGPKNENSLRRLTKGLSDKELSDQGVPRDQRHILVAVNRVILITGESDLRHRLIRPRMRT